MFAFISNSNPTTHKQYKKGLDELLQEGAVQLLRERHDVGAGLPLLAAVGQLQLDVVQFRLKHEYGVDSLLEPLSYGIARWCENSWAEIDHADQG